MSDQLVWQIVKNNHAFLVRRDGHEFSRERFNLNQRNSFKYSGLARSAAVDVSFTAPTEKKAESVAFAVKSSKQAGKPAKSAGNVAQNVTRNRSKGASVVAKQAAVRPDLAADATKRYLALSPLVRGRVTAA